MIKEEAISCIKQIKFRGYLRGANPFYEQDTEALEMAIQALEQEQDMTIAYLMGKYEDKEPCDDAISREAVMGLVAREHTEWDDLYIDIAKLPSVTQKSGKWRYVREDKYSCSKCGTTTRVDESGIDEKPMYKFCPYCGARMESEG